MRTLDRLRRQLADEFKATHETVISKPAPVQYISLAAYTSQNKTAYMRLLESTFGAPIEQLIGLDKGGVVLIGKRLGITPGCVTRWRKRFNIPTRTKIIRS